MPWTGLKMVTGGSWSDEILKTEVWYFRDRRLNRTAAMIVRKRKTEELTVPKAAMPSSTRQKRVPTVSATYALCTSVREKCIPE